MYRLWMTPVLASLLLAGCGDLPFVESPATDANTVFDPALVGSWTTGDAVVISKQGEGQNYQISWMSTEGMDSAKPILMTGKLIQIGDQSVLDLSASDSGPFSIPCHVFLRVRPAAEGLSVQFIDAKWIREQAKSEALEGFVKDGDPVITAAPSRIVTFLSKFAFDERALDEPMLLRPLKQN